MSLSEWHRNGWLKRQEPHAGEIADLLALAARDLKDCRAKGLSDDWKFNIAYNAALQASSAALAACGYAAAKGESSHFRVIQSLPLTINLPDDIVHALETCRKKRSMSVYDMAGVISQADVKRMTQIAEDLVKRIWSWLEDEHPDFLRPEPTRPHPPRRS